MLQTLMLMAMLSTATDAVKEVITRKEIQKLEGTWIIANAESFRKGEKWVIKDGQIEEGERSDRLLRFYRWEPLRRPMEIELTIMEQPDGQALLILQGIYTLEGDELRICFANPGEKRPARLPPAPNFQLLVLQKEKIVLAPERKQP
jgi:uncharacterized protein (TIGR03067 family)